MRLLIAILTGIFCLYFSVSASAQGWNPLDTTDQARQRHSAERYEYQQRNGTPLGGYPERLGDTAPSGAETPGYTNQYSNPYPSTNGSSGYNNNQPSYGLGSQHPYGQ